MQKFWSIFDTVSFIAVWIGVPLLVIFRRKGFVTTILTSPLLTWIALLLHNEFIHEPIASARASDMGNGILFFLGWFVGLIGTAVGGCIYLVIEEMRLHQLRRRALPLPFTDDHKP